MDSDLYRWTRNEGAERLVLYHEIAPPECLWYQEQWLSLTFYSTNNKQPELCYWPRCFSSGVLDGYNVTEVTRAGWEGYPYE